jgi:hypothetical protein
MRLGFVLRLAVLLLLALGVSNISKVHAWSDCGQCIQIDGGAWGCLLGGSIACSGDEGGLGCVQTYFGTNC